MGLWHWLGRLLRISLYVGRPMGVPTYIHWTALVSCALLWYRAGPDMAVGYGLALLSILLHELSHCFFARQYGYKPTSIFLSPLGGIAMVEMGVPQPLPEFVITIAGPLLSLALSVIAMPAWYLSWGVTQDLVDFFIRINAFIFLFNLLPAFPLDGGRILRCILNHRWKDVVKATTWAIYVSQAMCVLLAFIGLWEASPLLCILAWVLCVTGPWELIHLQGQLAAEELQVFDEKMALAHEFARLAAAPNPDSEAHSFTIR